MITIDVDPAVVDVTAIVYDALTLGLLVDLTSLVPAEVTVEAIPYTSIDLGEYYVTFTPAQAHVVAIAPGITLGEPSPVIEVLPALVNVVASDLEPIVGSFVPGDRYIYPLVIRESGTTTIDMSDYDTEVWVAYEADAPMEVTLVASSTDDFTMSLMSGATEDTLIVEEVSDTITTDVVTGLTYFLIESADNGTIDLTWSYTPLDTPLFMTVLTPTLERTPESLKVAVQGGLPNEEIRFTWNPPVSSLISGAITRPITLATIRTDFEGNILVGSLPLPPAYEGNYIVQAIGLTSGFQADATFLIANDPLPQDSGNVDVEPVASVTTRWLWDEGTGHTWVMPRNPDRMTSVIRPKILQSERTSSGNGQHIIWQGATPAIDWSFTGTIFTQDEREELEFFYELDRKFYITTHRNKTYIVTVKNLDMTPRRNGDNFETWDYTVQCYLYAEKVS